MSLVSQDPAISQILAQELQRQQTELNLIASENYADPLVLAVTGSILTNKYAEGYPGKRYYGGCQFVDQAERLAIERAQQLFQAPHVNVQPHSGSSANLAAYFSVLQPGAKILGLRLSEGGHLTHGHQVSFSGKFYQALSYGVDPETEQIDYQALEQLVAQQRPQLLVCGASAYARTLDFAKLAAIAHAHQALLLADIAHIAGLVATGLHPSPINHADIVTSTTHKTLRGPRGGLIMSRIELAEQIDKAVMPGVQGGPLVHVIAAKAVAFALALQPAFKQYQQQVLTNAQVMARTLAELGYRIVSGGTDTHLFLVDLRLQNLTGLAAEKALGAAGITVNRNCIPGDPEKPWITSGIRLGTPAMTTRGMREPEAQEIAGLIHEALQHHNQPHKLALIKMRVLTLCTLFGLPYQQATSSSRAIA
ncbi:MAG TPA: serine hydroxymethyltransferase [Candidatus Babeliales bacterium]|nr:serine hydroxymethyltransferase [Candidatus Babeliales bacterium]